jgi:hypothetical protein
MVTDTEITNFYTIVERWEETNTLGNLFIDKGIIFRQRTFQSVQQKTKKSSMSFRTTVVYEVHLTDEDILYIKLMHPTLQIIKRNYT